MITILVTITFKPEFTILGKKLVTELVKESKKETGCYTYQTFDDINDENTIVLMEIFYTEGDLDFHKNTKHVKEILKDKLVPMINEKITRFLK